MNPIVKNIALKLCESAPACVLEILFETLIKTWNDYIREYNLPFNRIDVSDLKGITAEKKLPIAEKDLNSDSGETNDGSSRISIKEVDEHIFFNYFRERVENPRQSFNSNNEAQSSTWIKQEHLIDSKADDYLCENDKEVNKGITNKEEFSVRNSANTALDEMIDSVEHKFKNSNSEQLKNVDSHEEKSKLNINKINKDISKKTDNINNTSPLIENITKNLASWFRVSAGAECKVCDSMNEKRKEVDDSKTKNATAPSENNNMSKLSPDIYEILQSLEERFITSNVQSINQPKKESQKAQYDTRLEKVEAELSISQEEENTKDSLEDLIELSSMQSVSMYHTATTSEVSKNVGDKHGSIAKQLRVGENKLFMNAAQEDSPNYFNRAVKRIHRPYFSINVDHDLTNVKKANFGMNKSEDKEDRFLSQLLTENTYLNEGNEKNSRKQTNSNKLNSLILLTDERSYSKEGTKTNALSHLNEVKYPDNKLWLPEKTHLDNKKDDTVSIEIQGASILGSANSDLPVENNTNRTEKRYIENDEISLNLISSMESDQEKIVNGSNRTENKHCAENLFQGEDSLSGIRKEIEIDEGMKKEINKNYINNSKSETKIKMDLVEVRAFVKIPQAPQCQLRCKEPPADINTGDVISQMDDSKEIGATTHTGSKNKSTHKLDRGKAEQNIPNKLNSKQTGLQKKMLWKTEHMTKPDKKIFQDSFSGDAENPSETDSPDEVAKTKCSNSRKDVSSVEQKLKDNKNCAVELERQHCNQQNGDKNKARNPFIGNKFKHTSDKKMIHVTEIHSSSTQEKKNVPRLPRPPAKINKNTINKTFSKYSLRADDYAAKKTCKESVQMGNRCNKNLNPYKNKTMIFGNCSECEEIQSEKTFGENHNSRRTLTKDAHPHVYYKDRRHRSKSKSVDRAKRKQHSNLSKKPTKPARKRVTFVEDNSIFSYDPDESIFETFYHNTGAEKKGKERDDGRENNAQHVKMDDRKESIKVYVTQDSEKENTQATSGEDSETRKSDVSNPIIEEKSSYTNLAFKEDALPDCPLEIEPVNSTSTNSTFEESEHLLDEKKSVTNTKSKTIPGKFSELRRQTECNAKRWFRDNLLTQKRMSFKKMKSIMKK